MACLLYNFDINNNKIFSARDRSGQKPFLYFYK